MRDTLFNPCRCLIVGLAALLALPCGGCTEFAHGVVDEPMANDVRLIGYWEPVDSPEKCYMRIAEASPTSLRIDTFNQHTCKVDEPMKATRTSINGMSFVDLTIPQHDTTNLIIPLEYEFDGQGTLSVGGPASVDLRGAIQNGTLPGSIEKSPSPGDTDKSAVVWGDYVHVDASTAELRQFFEAHSGQVAKPAMTFRRLPPATLPCEPGSPG